MPSPIHQEVVLPATPEQVYDAFMSSEKHAAFSGGPADISRENGGAFSCHGGQILGRNVELVPNQRIVQAWRVAAWPEGVYSIVKFELHNDGAKTKLVMDHSGVPDEAAEMVAKGWHMRYWEPLQKYLG